MLFIFGTRLFGKVDEVPGHFHVATEFFHIDYVPLFPTKSYLVTSNDGSGGWNGVPIPMSLKSVVVAWGRAAAIVAILVGVVLAGISSDSDRQLTALFTILFAAGAIVFTYKSSLVTRASHARACALARLAGMNEHSIRRMGEQFADGDEGSDEPAQAHQEESPSEPTAPVQTTFFVTGRNRESGDDVCITVWAMSAEEARHQATSRGVDVTAVEAGAKVMS